MDTESIGCQFESGEAVHLLAELSTPELNPANISCAKHTNANQGPLRRFQFVAKRRQASLTPALPCIAKIIFSIFNIALPSLHEQRLALSCPPAPSKVYFVNFLEHSKAPRCLSALTQAKP